MKTQKSRLQVLGVIVLVTMLISLFSPAQIVFADDTPPPTESSETIEVPAGEETSPEEDAAPEAETSESEETAAEEPATEEPVAEDPAPEEEAEAESVLAQLPEGTDVVVLDEEGEIVPLATTEAAAILAVPDPQFCPTGALPGDPTCGSVRGTIQEAVNDAKAAGVAGIVYIQSGTFNETVTIADFTTALTLQGVLSLAPYEVLTDPADRPVINGRILLVDGSDNEPGTDFANRANITLADLIINNQETTSGDDQAIYADRNTADLTFLNLDIYSATSGNSGLFVSNHSGNVFLTNVNASGTANRGVDINNTAGTGNVTVTGSTFNQNNGYGLIISSNGAIALENITADGNRTEDGVNLDNDNSGANGNVATVTITGNNSFSGNGNDGNDDGLYVVSRGSVSLENVTAYGNRDEGVEINNTPSSNQAIVQLLGMNVFTNLATGAGNTGYGLWIDSDGAITLENITANGSINDGGARLNNDQSGANSSSGVTITGVNSFSGNDEYGLEIDSRGAVALENITANNNVRQYGVNIDNESNANANVSSVTISGTNSFSGNDDYGLQINSIGTVTLSNITASGNKTSDGVYIDNINSSAKEVVINGTGTFNNNGNGTDTGDHGLYIRSQGNMTLADVVATGNKGSGVDISNTASTTNPGASVFLGSSNLSTLNSNGVDGLHIFSDGTITLINVSASSNADDGAELDNNEGGPAGANIEVVNGTFSNNIDDGLFADSNGNILLVNVTAQNNGHDGVELNFPSAGTHTATICDGLFSGQFGTGSGDYDVQVNNGDIRETNLSFANWFPNTSWGAAPCSYPDNDGDGIQDQWDADDDNDGVLDGSDACQFGASVGTDTDGDGCKDTTEDPDNDNDGVLNGVDACPVGASAGTDTDGDGCKDTTEDPDNDNDGVLNGVDACPVGASVGTDTDGDGCKDATEDSDDDNDGVADVTDNCQFVANPTQTDTDNDGAGDACDATPTGDDDNDGVDNLVDNCVNVANSDQADTDADGTGNVCDRTPNGDNDNDGIDNLVDNCRDAFNPEQKDTDENGIGDACDINGSDRPMYPKTLLIPVSGAAPSELSCTSLMSVLQMEGFEVTFAGLCGYDALLGKIEQSSLPGALPNGAKYVSGLEVKLMQDGKSVASLPIGTSMVVSFKIPAGMEGESFSILRWDGNKWVEESVTLENGYVKTTSSNTGTFVLVVK